MNEAPPIDQIEDPNMGSDQDIHSEKKYVDLDSVVVVKSGINAAPNDSYEALPALKAFLAHPARALSARELHILMTTAGEETKESVELVSLALDTLVDDGLVVQTNELDGKQFRYRLI